MAKNGYSLKEILEIGEKGKRQSALTEYAKSLKINITKARDEETGLDEDTLTVLIYDAEERARVAKNQIKGVLFIGFVVILFIGAIMFLFGNFMAPSIEKNLLTVEEDSK